MEKIIITAEEFEKMSKKVFYELIKLMPMPSIEDADSTYAIVQSAVRQAIVGSKHCRLSDDLVVEYVDKLLEVN